VLEINAFANRVAFDDFVAHFVGVSFKEIICCMFWGGGLFVSAGYATENRSCKGIKTEEAIEPAMSQGDYRGKIL